MMTVYVHPELRAGIEEQAPNDPVAHSALLFVSNLYLKAADSANFSDYFPLRSSLSREIYTTRNYGPMLALLFSLNAIEVEGGGAGSYRAGHRSKAYRLASKYRLGVVGAALDSPKLDARHTRAMERASYAAMSGKPHKWILQTFKTTTFTTLAADLLATHPFKTADARTRTINHADNVTNRRVRFSVCKTSGRIYHSVANLPKPLRAQLLIDGEPTSEIDISCSQPSLLSSLYNREDADHAAERTRYLASTQGGSFYEEIAAEAGKGWSRDETKTHFFHQIAYGSFYNADNYELLPAFTKRFPILARLMAAVKQRGNRELPMRMQTLEAKITIAGACGECAGKKIKVLPVHDSLICKTSEAETVKEILGRHWTEQTHIPASLKISGQN